MDEYSSDYIVTIKEVAKRAGVAISTVSRVINDLDRVSPETRERVKKAADELGFIKNSLAASMKTGYTKMIVVIVPDIVNDFYTSVIQGVEEIVAKRDYFTLVFANDDLPDKEHGFFDGEYGMIIDGAIMIPALDDPTFIRSIKKPVVLVDRYVTDCNVDSVVVDNYKGIYLLTQELIHYGHKDIGIIIGPDAFNIGKERINGFYSALRESNIPLNERYIVHSTWYQEEAYKHTIALLSDSQPPTALVASNNLICTGAIRAIEDMGLTLGKDISLVGFDDTLLAQYIKPGITVVRRATAEMGRIGAELLLGKLEGTRSSKSVEKIVLDVELVRRNSIVKLN